MVHSKMILQTSFAITAKGIIVHFQIEHDLLKFTRSFVVKAPTMELLDKFGYIIMFNNMEERFEVF